jgi:hypothetical protein
MNCGAAIVVTPSMAPVLLANKKYRSITGKQDTNRRERVAATTIYQTWWCFARSAIVTWECATLMNIASRFALDRSTFFVSFE